MNKDCVDLLKSLDKGIKRLVVDAMSKIKRVEVVKLISNHYKKLYKLRKLK